MTEKWQTSQGYIIIRILQHFATKLWWNFCLDLLRSKFCLLCKWSIVQKSWILYKSVWLSDSNLLILIILHSMQSASWDDKIRILGRQNPPHVYTLETKLLHKQDCAKRLNYFRFWQAFHRLYKVSDHWQILVQNNESLQNNARTVTLACVVLHWIDRGDAVSWEMDFSLDPVGGERETEKSLEICWIWTDVHQYKICVIKPI